MRTPVWVGYIAFRAYDSCISVTNPVSVFDGFDNSEIYRKTALSTLTAHPFE